MMAISKSSRDAGGGGCRACGGAIESVLSMEWYDGRPALLPSRTVAIVLLC